MQTAENPQQLNEVSKTLAWWLVLTKHYVTLKKQNAWNAEMERATSMKDESLHRVTEDVRSFVTEVNPKFLTTLKYKFQKPDYKEVANLPFNFWEETMPTAGS